MLPNFHIFGVQGSGKDTQASALAPILNLIHLSSGVLLRARAEGSDIVGNQIRDALEAGHLVSDELLFAIVSDALEQRPQDKGIIGAGIIRTQAQLTWLDAKHAHYGLGDIWGIELQVPVDVARQRMESRHRPDDTPAIISERLRLFEMETKPVIHELQTRGHLIQVDGTEAPTTVTQTLIPLLTELMTTTYVTH
jgi:adenylate kinase